MKKLLFLCLTLLLVAGLARSEPDQNPKTEKGAKRDQRGTEKQPLVIKGIPAAKTDAETREEREHRERQISIGTSVGDALKGLEKESEKTTVLTLLLLLIALVQACLFLWQLRDMRRATRSASASARAAARNAKAAERSLNMTMSAESPVLIAEVITAGLTDPIPNAPGIRPVVSYRISNYGKTPATVRKFQDRLRWAGILPESPDFDGEPLEARPERNILLISDQPQNIFNCASPTNVPEPFSEGSSKDCSPPRTQNHGSRKRLSERKKKAATDQRPKRQRSNQNQSGDQETLTKWIPLLG